MAKKPIKKNSLHNVVVRKISLVDRPANQGATVLLYKRDEETEETMSDPQKTPNEAAEALAKTEAQLQEANETIGELTDALNEVNHLLTKRNEEETEIQKRIEVLEKENEQLKKAATAAAGDDESPWAALDGLIQKGDNPLLEKALQAIRKNHEDLAKQLAEAEEVKKRQAEKAEEAEAIRKAADEFKRLPTKPEELGPLLMRVEKGMTTQDDATEVRRLLKAADAVIGGGVGASNLFKELGSGGSQGSALDQVNAEADEIMKADGKITRATAITKALEKRPELYTAYQQEKRAAQ